MKQQTTTYNVELFCQRRVYTRVKSGLFVLQFTESASFLSKTCGSKDATEDRERRLLCLNYPSKNSKRIAKSSIFFLLLPFYHPFAIRPLSFRYPILLLSCLSFRLRRPRVSYCQKVLHSFAFFLSLFIQNTVKLFMYMC